VQVEKQQQALQKLYNRFLTYANYSQYEHSWHRYFYGSILFYHQKTKDAALQTGNPLIEIVRGKQALAKFLLGGPKMRNNLLTKPILRKFIVFLAGYRPNRYIMPKLNNTVNDHFTNYVTRIYYGNGEYPLSVADDEYNDEYTNR
jgi:hypothetical protein